MPCRGMQFQSITSSTRKRKKLFFHFLLLNFLFTIAASALLYLWLRRFVNPLPAWAGSLLYLFSFYAVTVNLIPMSDAACHLAIIAAILCLQRPGLVARLTFAIVAIFGALSKEAFFLVMIPWIALRAIGNLREARALLWLLPAFAAFAAMVIWMPQGAGAVAGLGAAGDVYLGSEANARVQEGWDTWRVFYPGTYDRSFVFHTVLANLPLLAAVAGWGWLRTKGVRVPAVSTVGATGVAAGRALALVPLLLVFGIALGLGNNAARLAFMAFPAVALFQARVLDGLAREG